VWLGLVEDGERGGHGAPAWGRGQRLRVNVYDFGATRR
jgi:hypothetical protein